MSIHRDRDHFTIKCLLPVASAKIKTVSFRSERIDGDESAQCLDEDIGYRAPDTQQQKYFWVERVERKNIWSAGDT